MTDKSRASILELDDFESGFTPEQVSHDFTEGTKRGTSTLELEMADNTPGDTIENVWNKPPISGYERERKTQTIDYENKGVKKPGS